MGLPLAAPDRLRIKSAHAGGMCMKQTRARVRQAGCRGRQPLRCPHPPVGAIHESPADPRQRPRPTSGPPGASAPTEQTDVSLPPCHCEPVRTLAWQSVSFVSVGEGLAPPADPRRCPKNGRGQAPPLRSRPTSPVSFRTCQGTHKFYRSFVAKNL